MRGRAFMPVLFVDDAQQTVDLRGFWQPYVLLIRKITHGMKDASLIPWFSDD